MIEISKLVGATCVTRDNELRLILRVGARTMTVRLSETAARELMWDLARELGAAVPSNRPTSQIVADEAWADDDTRPMGF